MLCWCVAETPAKPKFKRKNSSDSSHDPYAILHPASDSISIASLKELSAKSRLNEMAEDSSEDSSQDARRKKKARTTFTGRQIFELEKQFEIKKYLSSSERADMAKLLNVTETQVSF